MNNKNRLCIYKYLAGFLYIRRGCLATLVRLLENNLISEKVIEE